MTSTTANDPWAAASAETPTNVPAGESQLAGDLPGADEQESQLFSGGVSYPSLFNKTHPVGTVRTGIIRKVTDVHSRTYSTEGPGDLKYWQEGSDKPVTAPINVATQKPNRPVLDTHFELDTDYRVTAEECAAINRKPDYVERDEGKRVFAAGGYDLKAVRAALAEQASALGIRKTADLLGKRITVKRAGQKPNPGGNPSWVLEVRFDNA